MFKVFGFYKFIKIKSLKKNKDFLQKFLISNNIRGTIIIAKEGLNGTISGCVKDIDKTTKKLKSLFSFKLFDNSNESKSKFQPFHKPKVKIKKEVVPMNLTINSKDRNIQNHLEPKDWNKLIKNKDTHIIDTRKPFEYKVGTFKKFDNSNESKSKFQPFRKPKVKIKKEVVPMNLTLNSKDRNIQTHLDPKEWNKLIKNKDTHIIDTRKPFEYKVGTFKKSVNPNINNFRDFPKYLNKLKKNKPVAMFCTGGIRCEKTSVYLKKKGFENIFQLNGGILNYLKKIKKTESLWKGECFVFDNRISLKHELKIGTYSVCSGCRMPISPKDKRSNKYEEGVSCPNCHAVSYTHLTLPTNREV